MENEDPYKLQMNVGASHRIFLFSFDLHRAAMLDFSTSVGRLLQYDRSINMIEHDKISLILDRNHDKMEINNLPSYSAPCNIVLLLIVFN